VKKLTMFNR